jgi:hypothetical protein
LVSTVYTAAGGIKAVIWTDSLQAFFLYAGLAVLLIKGTVEAGWWIGLVLSKSFHFHQNFLGGFWKVMEINEATGRLSKAMARYSPTVLQVGLTISPCICPARFLLNFSTTASTSL